MLIRPLMKFLHLVLAATKAVLSALELLLFKTITTIPFHLFRLFKGHIHFQSFFLSSWGKSQSILFDLQKTRCLALNAASC